MGARGAIVGWAVGRAGTVARGCAVALAVFVAVPGAHADEWTVFTESNFILDLAVDSAGVWAATPGGAIRLAADGTLAGRFTNLDGLPSNHLQVVARDTAGDLWFGTMDAGAAGRHESENDFWLYGGVEGLFTEDVTALFPVADGMWVGTTGGVAKFKHGEREAEGRNRFNAGTGLMADSVLAIAEAGGSLWFGTSRGLTQLDPDSGFVDHLAGEKVNVLTLHGESLFAGTDRRVYRWDGAEWDTLGPGLATRQYRDLLFMGDTLFAAVQPPRPVIRWTGSAWVVADSGIVAAGSPEGWKSGRALGHDPAGGFWAGTDAGLARREGGVWVPATTTGVASNFIISIGGDPEGGIWFATGSDGNLFQYGSEPWAPEQGVGRGVSRYLHGSWRTYTSQTSGLVHNNVYRVAADSSGTVWIGTWDGGLSGLRLSDSTWTTIRAGDGLGTDVVAAAAADTAGNMWFASYGLGVVVRTVAGEWFPYTPGSGLPSGEAYTYPRALALGGQMLWVGTYGVEVSGLAIARVNTRGSPETRGDDQITNYLPQGNWSSVEGTVHCLTVDPDGRMWAGTAAGAATFSGSTWRSYTVAGGEAIGEVRTIARDAHGNHWFATRQGLLRLGPDLETWQSYTAATSGLPGDDLMSIFVEPATGDIWIGTWGSGAARLRPSPPATTAVAGDRLPLGPNPFRPAEDGQVQFTDLGPESVVRIYSLGGVLVRVLPSGVTKTWDGTDDLGAPVASGAYLVTGEDERGVVRRATMAVVR